MENTIALILNLNSPSRNRRIEAELEQPQPIRPPTHRYTWAPGRMYSCLPLHTSHPAGRPSRGLLAMAVDGVPEPWRACLSGLSLSEEQLAAASRVLRRLSEDVPGQPDASLLRDVCRLLRSGESIPHWRSAFHVAATAAVRCAWLGLHDDPSVRYIASCQAPGQSHLAPATCQGTPSPAHQGRPSRWPSAARTECRSSCQTFR